uniref:hypothetical protein n=1 Tax=Trichocoleus desertorum TaxID=1481672 RepID=UPI0025B3975A|nr:hypothetical protein [Trichocoleus desertorum]
MLLMKAHNRDAEKPPVRPDSQRQNSANGNLLSKVAILFSVMALTFSGFAIYQVKQLQAPAPSATKTPQSKINPDASSSTSATTTSPTTSATTDIATTEPGKLVQLALDNKAEVTLLTAERIQDPDTGNSDVVNVKLRIRRLAENVSAYDFINVGGAVAQEPESTIATYQPVDPIKKSTGPISLQGIRKEASADAYVWLRVPEGVSTLNIRVPGAEVFEAVKIVN